MIITCTNCNKKFEVDSNLIPNEGRQLQCSSCNYEWFFKKKILADTVKKDDSDVSINFDDASTKKKDELNISVNLGKLSCEWDKIPLSKNIDALNIPLDIDGFGNGVAVNVGTPHVVFFGKNINEINLAKIGPTIENNILFPNKINVELVEIINKKKLKCAFGKEALGLL